MKLKQLHYFFAVASYLNYKTAAIAMGVSQSVLSQQIVELENSIGTPLLSRNKQSVELTAAGQELLAQLPDLFNMIDNIFSLVHSYDKDNKYTSVLRIGYEQIFDLTQLTEYMTTFKETSPTTHFIVRHYNFQGLINALQTGGVDIGFFVLPNIGFPNEVGLHILEYDNLVLVMDKTLSEKGDFATLSSIYPIICNNNPASLSSLISICAEWNIVPKYILFDNNDDIIYRLQIGNAVAILPEQYVYNNLNINNIVISPIPKASQNNICTIAVYNTNGTPNIVKEFLNTLPCHLPSCHSCINSNNKCQFANP